MLTREEAVDRLVEQDVARWGEETRESSRRQHSQRTLGLALNELANRAELSGQPDPELRKAAKKALTSDDWARLRRGG